MKVAPQVTALQAQAAANVFLSDILGDRFTADQAKISATNDVWEVPVILTYPLIGSVGQVGEILVSKTSEVVVSHTPIEEMKQSGQSLYEAHRDEIQAAFS
ncbi:hypothetical protein [Iningainema tapete]|uniref:Uncharacterized protein n=1 Tax=Iningainema tapete BLCC-T55 TaxID=2748662 RepID=A0A8J7BW29_9CYAN|nr:hypothetical protein [Iningainema tapete]MBD2771047.1 hypothetical protein [Iningainema tapete BLCC-T55]